MRQIKKGSVDRSVVIRIIDSTDGTPEEGVVYNTAGIDLWYRREGATRTAITEATLAALDSAHADGGFLHIDDGYYRLDLPDAAWLTGANHVMIGGTVTGMIVIGQEVQLVNFDPEDTVRLGLTALPNAAANAAGGLPISAAGGLALDTKLANTNEVTAARMGALTDLIDGGRLDLILDIIAADTTTDIPATLATIAGYLTTEIAEIYAAVITNAAGADVAADIIALKAVVDTIVGRVIGTIATGTHNPQSGDAFARLGAPAGASIAADLVAIEAQTDDIGAAGVGLTAVPWNSTWDAEVQSEVADALAAYDPPTKAEMDTAHALLATIAEMAKIPKSDAAVSWNATALAAILAQANAALEAANLDHIAGTAAGIPAIPAGTYIDQIMDDGTATFDRTTDSLQALRDRGDAAWVTGGGGAITQILNFQPVIPYSIDLAGTATVRLGVVLVNSVDDLPSTAEITPGTISIYRKAIGGTAWTTVVNAAALSEIAGMVYYDEVFDSGTGYAEGDTIRIEFAGISITADTNTFEIVGATGISFYTEIRQTMRGTNSAALASVCTEGRLAELDTANMPNDLDNILDDVGDVNAIGINIQTRIPASLVSGRIDASVGAMAADVLTAAALAAGAIDLASVAADLKTGNYLNVQVKGQDNIDFGALQKASLNAATPASVVGAVGSVAGAVGSVTGNVGGNVTGSVGSLATQAKADVNAEVVDVLNVDTYAEPGQEAPAATVSLVKKIGYLFKAWRNKKDNNGAENKLYADDATTVDQKQSTTESGGTVTKGEWTTGA